MASEMTLLQISMRGRVAFAVMCLEEAILRLAQDPVQWTWLLTRLWTYTSTADLDEWQDKTGEMTPSVVVASKDYRDSGCRHLEPEEYTDLRALYRSSPSLLGELVELVFDIGTLEMFGGIQNGAPESLAHIRAVLKLMEEHSLSVPDVSAVAGHSFAECQGWGSPFQSEHLSRIVGRLEG